jgi:hypothetical protein
MSKKGNKDEPTDFKNNRRFITKKIAAIRLQFVSLRLILPIDLRVRVLSQRVFEVPLSLNALGIGIE